MYYIQKKPFEEIRNQYFPDYKSGNVNIRLTGERQQIYNDDEAIGTLLGLYITFIRISESTNKPGIQLKVDSSVPEDHDLIRKLEYMALSKWIIFNYIPESKKE